MKIVKGIVKQAALTSLVWRGDGLFSQLFLFYCRNTPEFWGKRRIYQWVASSCFQNQLRLCNCDGVKFRIDASDFIGRSIAFTGNYEGKSLELARTLLSSGGVFVDIGCNIGLYTLCLGAVQGVQAYSIDASFVALAKLQQNLHLNPNIQAQIVSCAMASDGLIQCFELPVARNLGTTSLVENSKQHLANRFWVGSSPLQKVFERLGVSKIRLLKIDVEGTELSVFQGLDLDGAFRPENIIIECDLEFPKALDCFNFLIEKGYVPFTVEGERRSDPQNLPEMNVWFRCSSLLIA